MSEEKMTKPSRELTFSDPTEWLQLISEAYGVPISEIEDFRRSAMNHLLLRGVGDQAE